MKNLKEFGNTAIKRWKDYLSREKRIEKKIEELKKKKDRLHWPGMRKIFIPFAEEIKKRLKADEYEWFGPFGLSNEQTIYWKKDNNKCMTEKGNVLGSLCLIHFGGGYAIRNERENTKRYAKGTLGEMNGMNNPTIELTDKMNMDWLLKFVKRNK